MVITTIQKEALQGLCSKDRLDLMDAIDRLRSEGIDHLISLPRSSCSVLEAISGVPFPARSNLCTRFPAELVLRRTSQVSARISIVPHMSRDDSEKATLSTSDEKLDTFEDLARLIGEATSAMGISTHGRAFARDLLRVEISGPDRPHLTIVDLPGLIHSETKHQKASDVDLIKETVKSYMCEPRSIILAVVSAKNDFANQIVLKLARTVDHNGERTLGIVTKPDMLIPDSDSEALYILLARNQEVNFRLGWHVVKNMDSEKETGSIHRRNTFEADFFAQGVWKNLPSAILGVVHLRSRLSKVLLKHITAELPSLITEIDAKRQACRTQMEKLGRPRNTHYEQQLHMITISESFQRLVRNAADGNWTDSFFEAVETGNGYKRRLRAFVQNNNDDFAADVLKNGQRHHIKEGGKEASDASTDARSISRDEFIRRIMDKMSLSRGRELPGSFDPMIIAELFREQAGPWEALALSHVQRVWDACKVFLRQVIDHVADTNTSMTVLQRIISPAMDAILADLRDKTSQILKQHQELHPITYNHYFTETLQKIRTGSSHTKVASAIMKYFQTKSLTVVSYGELNLATLVDKTTLSTTEPDMNKFAASEALDMMVAYYKVAMKRFIDDIAVSVIEAGLVLALHQMLSPAKVYKMDTELVASLASETEENRVGREQAVRQLEVLDRSAQICRQFSVDGMGTASFPLSVLSVFTQFHGHMNQGFWQGDLNELMAESTPSQVSE
ncbi:P-loop containing nucleoside triphosphate hydrolase protein [Microdochium trichocladiopsis]|uniref:P-loop containing nucleoside triphosphate hydrolase protein n=1 Tax=Microdochium trichocladiopsis TaxID=1682393 RepID=A0A9P9BEW6_9PEZI|nr:P-loop containing nucleoside triphosphate hydrolase protein [Microdochium trichocladiopsis]KAH7009250.1 P-loop containing nucleoside triphosphate hydrolase protein [Microdochium trichocladiopsis]